MGIWLLGLKIFNQLLYNHLYIVTIAHCNIGRLFSIFILIPTYMFKNNKND